jgi:hypothetical protein
MADMQWRDLFKAAILELDPEQLQVRVRAAEDAINGRISSGIQVSRTERKAMEDALSTLRVLKRKLF